MKYFSKLFAWGFFACAVLFAAVEKVEAKIFLVNDNGDSSICDNTVCTLRGAIEASNENGEVDIISFDPTIKYIAINKELYIEADDSLDLDPDLTIAGAVTIDAQQKSRVFSIAQDTHVIINRITITGGLLTTIASKGAGIYNEGIVKLYNAKVQNNAIKYNPVKKKSFVKGAGIYNASGASLTIVKSHIGPRNVIEITGVDVEAQGAGIYNNGLFSISDSIIFSNKIFSYSKEQDGFAKAFGGGLFTTAGTPAYVYATTIYANKVESKIEGKPIHASSDGAGVYVDSSSKLYITNSTISANESVSYAYTDQQSYPFAHAGAIYAGPYSKVYVANTTIADNSASSPTSDNPGSAGGHAFFVITVPDTEFVIKNSIVVSEDNNCVYKIISEGYNVISDTSCFKLQEGDKMADPILKPLASNGGFTKTHALSPDSPAIDAGNEFGCIDFENKPIWRDQRGNYRPKDSCDAGAFEL